MNIGTKVKFTNTFKESMVVKAKKGQTGIFKGYKDYIVFGKGEKLDGALIELSNGEVIHVPRKFIEEYSSSKRTTIRSMSNEGLLEAFEYAVAKEQNMKMKTNAYEKQLDKINKLREELLKRLNKEQRIEYWIGKIYNI